MFAEKRWAGNLPAETTSFAGRTQLRAEIRRALTATRLVTLAGVGGVGKTRLAVRTAADMRAQFPHGVWLADLSGLRDTRLLVTAIATTLGVQDRRTGSEIDALTEYLADKSLLLILDSFEHLANSCALLTEILLPAAPGLRILATGRQPLNLRGERVYTVPPLQLPGHGETTSEATRLLTERASGFTAAPGDEAAIARLCRRLDGIPLALELAAVRLGEIAPERLLSELDDRFQRQKTSAPRHQTLRTAIGWSHELCRSEERLLWARISIFPGGFDLPAAQYICSDLNLSPQTIEQVLDRLVAKSIVLRTGDRYRMLDTIAEFGQHWLRALDEEYQIRRRHRDFYLRRARQGEVAWSGRHQEEWYRRTILDHANFRAALDFSLNTPREREAGLVLASTLWYHWACCGAVREGRHYLDRAIDLVTTPSAARTKALWVCGWVSALQGDTEHAAELAEAARLQSQTHHDPTGSAYAAQVAGLPAFLSGDLDTAIASWTVALDHHRANGELNPGFLVTLPQLAMALALTGELSQAKAALNECISICDEAGEVWSRSITCSVLSMVELLSGDLDQAWSHARSALHGKTLFDDVIGTTMCIELLAWVAAARGDGERAAKLFGAAVGNWRAFGLPLFESAFYEVHHDQFERAARELIGDGRFAALHADGLAMDLPEAVAYALAESTGQRSAPLRNVQLS